MGDTGINELRNLKNVIAKEKNAAKGMVSWEKGNTKRNKN